MLRKHLEMPPDSTTPISPRQFGWYVTFWHIVYLAMLAVMLSAALWNGRAALGWREVALTILVLGQTGLYFKILIFNERWPIPNRHYAVYFGGSLILWFLEWQLAPHFFWVIMSYLGQMYGLLPPVFAIPGTSLIYLFVFGRSINWNFSLLDPGEWFGIFMSYMASNVVFIFLYYISRTSSQRARLILELKAAQAELEAARERDTELAVLRERERLARDLHDSLGHSLTTLTVQLEAVQRLYRVDPDRASTQVDELKTLTRHSMDDLRRSLDGLRAPGLGDRKLRDALQTLCVEAGQRLQIEIQCSLAAEADDLSPAVAETIWRATQEALTNVEKHARARRVQVNLSIHGGAVTLRVADDGLGLPPGAESRPGHYGLRGMRERVEGLGGTLSLAGAGGATIEVRLPIITAPHAAARIPSSSPTTTQH